MRAVSEALQASDVDTDPLALQGVHPACSMPSSCGVEREAPQPPEDLSSPLSGVYLKGFGHAFQNASLECDIPDVPFYIPLMQMARLKWP